METIELYGASTSQFRLHNHALYQAIQQASGMRYIIDSSKDISRMQRLLKETALPVRPILLRRRMEGIVYSAMRKRRGWLSTLVYSSISLSRMRYLLADVEHLVVHYEDLAVAPEATLKRIWEWLDLAYEPTWQTWAEQDYHLFSGNRMRRNPNPQIRLDDEWQSELSLLQKAVCRGVGALCGSQFFYPTLKWLKNVSRR